MPDDKAPPNACLPLASADDEADLERVLALAEAAAWHDGHHVLSPADRADLITRTPALLAELQLLRRVVRSSDATLDAMLACFDQPSSPAVTRTGGAHAG